MHSKKSEVKIEKKVKIDTSVKLDDVKHKVDRLR